MFIKNHTLLEGISCEGKKEASRTNIFIQYMTKTIKITIKIKIKVKFLAFSVIQIKKYVYAFVFV